MEAEEPEINESFQNSFVEDNQRTGKLDPEKFYENEFDYRKSIKHFHRILSFFVFLNLNGTYLTVLTVIFFYKHKMYDL